MKIRYCIEYINPRHPLRDDGCLNVRHNRVLTLEQAEHDLTLILSFGGKILDLYMGNVVEGKTGEWTPKPMIVDDDDWFTTDWLNTLEVKKIDLEDSKKEELAQKYVDYIFRRHDIDENSKEGMLIYYAYMHGMNQCLTQLRKQKEE